MEHWAVPQMQPIPYLHDVPHARWQRLPIQQKSQQQRPEVQQTDYDTLLDTLAVTAKSFDYIEKAREHGVTDWLPVLSTGIEKLRNEARATIDECNDFIHKIGGIPVRVNIDSGAHSTAQILGFTQFKDGVWTFKCRTADEPTESMMSGSTERLREVYSATLPPEPNI